MANFTYVPRMAMQFIVFTAFMMMTIHIDANDRYDVLGIGSPCVDLLFKVDDAFIKEASLNKGDGKRGTWEAFDSVLTLCKKRGFKKMITTGGCTTNALKGLSKLGNACALYGTRGNDEMGRFIEKTLKKFSITPLLTVSETPTSQIGVFVTDDHQRSFLSFPGANLEIAETDFPDNLFKAVKVIHIEGYLVDELGIAYFEKILEAAKKENVIIAFDMGCPRIASTYSKEIMRLLPKIDMVFANQDEIAALLGQTAESGCAELAKYAKVAVVGIGKDGCWVSSCGHLFHSPAITVEAIDTTGAGDLFACGFIHGYLKGCRLEECASIGNLLGGTVVTVMGAQIPDGLWDGLIQKIDEIHSTYL